VVIGGPPSFDRVRNMREVLTATGAGIYLANHLAGPIPAEAMAAVHESDDMELRVGRVGPDRGEDLDQREKEARAVTAAALRTSPERVVLTHGAAQGAGAIALEVLAATEVSDPHVLLLGAIEPIVVAAVRASAGALGATIETHPALPAALDDVALVVVAHVDRNGRRADVVAIAEAAHGTGARLLVDATLSVGAMDFSADELNADALVADVDRWLLGPDAVAIAWLAAEMGDRLPGQLRSGIAPFGRGVLLALARSVGWLLMYVELPWALARTEELADRLYEGLVAIDGVELVADPVAHGAVAAFHISDWDAEAAAEELSRSVFAIVEAAIEADLIRASVGAWNRESELDRFLERVAELAAHTPQTLPRRPSLTVISGPLEPPEEG
jgi:selenocysteine lyase/cysteine desulfurase